MMSEPLPPQAIAALAQLRKVDAIKIVRRERGLDLKAAKDAVDAYIETQPDLKRRITAAQAEAKRGCLIWIAMIGVIIVAVVLWKTRAP